MKVIVSHYIIITNSMRIHVEKENEMSELFSLFITFCKIGALTFGGGYAMLPIIQRYVVEGKKWATDEEVMDFYAVGQCLPGIIAINTAAFIGHKVKGKPGEIAAAFGVAFPSFVIIAIIAAFIRNFIEYQIVQNAFYGIRIAVVALVVEAIIKMWKKGMKDIWCYLLFTIAFVLSLLGVSTVLIVLGSVLLGMLIKQIPKRQKEVEGGEK